MASRWMRRRRFALARWLRGTADRVEPLIGYTCGDRSVGSYDTASDQARFDAADISWSPVTMMNMVLLPQDAVIHLGPDGGEILVFDHTEDQAHG